MLQGGVFPACAEPFTVTVSNNTLDHNSAIGGESQETLGFLRAGKIDWARLPNAAATMKSDVPSPTAFENDRWPGGRVLVVESNNFQCHELVGHLVALGFDVFLARDGEEALHQAQTRRPDIVIIDPIIPGLDGFEFCYEMKKNQDLASIPVILSPLGSATEVDAELAQDLGAAGYVSRTPDFCELDEVLKTTLIKKYGNPVNR